ncbi:MAG: type II toxin-antitoxin system RelB/DinJ family antitoxin [bacterium]
MNTLIHIRTDKIIKDEAQRILEDLGFNISSYINASLRKLVKERKIEFSYYPNSKTKKDLLKIEKDVKKGRNLSTPFSSGKKMDEYLNSL